jgi:superfamily I DNA/RNA helicase
MDVSDLIGEIVKGTKYEAFLQTSHVNDFKDRFENILELKAYAKHVADENPSGLAKLSNDVGEDGEDIIEEEEGEGDDSGFANLESIFE